MSLYTIQIYFKTIKQSWISLSTILIIINYLHKLQYMDNKGCIRWTGLRILLAFILSKIWHKVWAYWMQIPQKDLNRQQQKLRVVFLAFDKYQYYQYLRVLWFLHLHILPMSMPNITQTLCWGLQKETQHPHSEYHLYQNYFQGSGIENFPLLLLGA